MGQMRTNIPVPVLRRLPKYRSYIQELRLRGVEWISSQELAEALGLTSSTVRQDLSHVDVEGISKRGYKTEALAGVLGRELGGGRAWKAVVVGAGNLGCALATHREFHEQGFDIRGIFDASSRVVGKKVGAMVVRGMDELRRVVKGDAVDIGILAVPAASAQDAADQLVAAGIEGLLNMACSHIRVPAHVAVVDARILESLQELACLVYLARSKNGVEAKA